MLLICYFLAQCFAVTLTYLGIFLKVVILYSTGLVVTQHLSSSGDPMINALEEGMCIFVG